MDDAPRSGWNWLNVLALLGVALVVVAALLPNIQGGPANAKRLQCVENLRQLGLALHNYHDNHGTLPPGIVAADDPSRTGDLAVAQFVAESAVCDSSAYAKASGFTMLLPYFEEKLAYDQYNKRLACCAIQNATSVATRVNILVCPSAPHGGQPFANAYYAGKTVGRTDYAFALGGLGVPSPHCPLGHHHGPRRPRQFEPGASAMGVNGGVPFNWIGHGDGLTNTIFIAECAGGASAAVRSGGLPIHAGETAKVAVAGPQAAAAWSQGYIPGPRGQGGYGSVFAASAYNAWYSDSRRLADPKGWTAIPVNEGMPDAVRPTWMQNSAPPEWAARPWPLQQHGWIKDGSVAPPTLGSMAGFRSWHPQLAQCVWGDGSVRVVGQNTSAQALVAYTSIRGGELIDVPSSE